ncbi:MAG TPA: hypothetical protein VF708_04320 [Pyrinomonadaceae bacterium]|jgi:hypothetical protein
MNDRETSRFEMFLSVREFRNTEAARFPAGSYALELAKQLDGIIDEIETHASTQSSGLRAVKESGTSKAVDRDELRRDLEAISRTARIMTTPGLEDKFRLPRAPKDQELLTVARSFAADATPLKVEFVKRGLPADFLDDLNADTERFEASISRKIQGAESHVAATAAIDDLIDRGMKVVRELDVLMRNTLDDNEATLAAWLSASHVKRSKGKKDGERPAPPPPPQQ